LIDPDRAENLVKNLLAKYEENGMLPKIEYGNNDTKGHDRLSFFARDCRRIRERNSEF
jgi:putative alpha-1,2-mannosidase